MHQFIFNSPTSNITYAMYVLLLLTFIIKIDYIPYLQNQNKLLGLPHGLIASILGHTNWILNKIRIGFGLTDSISKYFRIRHSVFRYFFRILSVFYSSVNQIFLEFLVYFVYPFDFLFFVKTNIIETSVHQRRAL